MVEQVIQSASIQEILDLKNLKANSDLIEANGSATVTISNVAPAGVGTATISQWLKVDVGGTTYYIPMWT